MTRNGPVAEGQPPGHEMISRGLAYLPTVIVNDQRKKKTTKLTRRIAIAARRCPRMVVSISRASRG